MSNIENMNCCGVHEIAGIIDDDNPEETVKEVCHDIFEENNCAFMIFTDICKKTPGKNLEKYIKDNNLGETTKSCSKINPNSHNSLTIWTWALNRKNLKIWYNKRQSPNA